MANSYVRVAPDSTGKYVQTYQNTVGSTAVEANAVVLTDENGTPLGYTGLRDTLVAQRCTTLSDSLADGIAGFWTQTTASGGGIASTGGEGRLTTSTAATGSAQIVSTNVAYYPGQVAWLNSAIRFGDTGTAGNIRRLGMFTVSGTTPQEGFYFELSGTTLNAVTVKGGSATAVASTSWTRFSTDPFTLDTNYHSFEIRYTANTVWFFIDNVLRHQVSGTSASLTSSLTLPITVTNVKTSGGTDITFAIRNIGNGRFGQNGGVVAETGLSAVEALAVGGGTPHDSVDSGNPLKVGGYASATAPTAVAGGDRVNAWLSLNGAQIIRPQADIGRNQTNYFMAAHVAATTSEVMMSLTGYKSGAAVGATATPAVVTAGKTYRITNIVLEYKGIATLTGGQFRLRANTSGVAVVGSPLVDTWTLGQTLATAGAQDTSICIVYPEGLEFAAGTGIAVGYIGLSTAGVPGTAAGLGRISITGYEY